jgi:hypothetical protein
MSEKKKLNFLNLWSNYGDFNFFFQFPKKIPSYKWHLPKCGGGHNFSTMATNFCIFSENFKRIKEKNNLKNWNFSPNFRNQKIEKNKNK